MQPHVVLFIVITEALGFLVLIALMRKRIQELTDHTNTYRRERRAILTLLDKTGERITSDVDIEGTLEIINEFIVETARAESGAIFIMDESGEFLTAKSVVGLFPPIHAKTDYVLTRPKHLKAMLQRDKVAIGEGLIGRVAAEGRPLLIVDAAEDSRVPDVANSYVKMRSVMITPLKIRDRILGVFAVVNKRGDDESFTESDMNLMMALADQAAVTVDIWRLYQEMARKHRIDQDLRLARDFQRLLLPEETPEIPGFDVAAFNETALDIGGDYYDFLDLGGDRWGIVIGDVSGKGIPGALVMAMVRASVRTEAMRSQSPKEVLRNVNRRLLGDTSDNTFITMTYGVLDTEARTLRFARCGHEPTITSCPETTEMHLHTPEGIALGLVDDEIFDIVEEMEINLEPGGLTVLYTDGVIEAMDSHRNEYGQERLFQTIQNHRGSARELIDNVVGDIGRFTSGIPQYDDLTMVVLRAKKEAVDQRQVEDEEPDKAANDA